jgi:hypothetical protein
MRIIFPGSSFYILQFINRYSLATVPTLWTARSILLLCFCSVLCPYPKHIDSLPKQEKGTLLLVCFLQISILRYVCMYMPSRTRHRDGVHSDGDDDDGDGQRGRTWKPSWNFRPQAGRRNRPAKNWTNVTKRLVKGDQMANGISLASRLPLCICMEMKMSTCP